MRRNNITIDMRDRRGREVIPRRCVAGTQWGLRLVASAVEMEVEMSSISSVYNQRRKSSNIAAEGI